MDGIECVVLHVHGLGLMYIGWLGICTPPTGDGCGLVGDRQTTADVRQNVQNTM